MDREDIPLPLRSFPVILETENLGDLLKVAHEEKVQLQIAQGLNNGIFRLEDVPSEVLDKIKFHLSVGEDCPNLIILNDFLGRKMWANTRNPDVTSCRVESVGKRGSIPSIPEGFVPISGIPRKKWEYFRGSMGREVDVWPPKIVAKHHHIQSGGSLDDVHPDFETIWGPPEIMITYEGDAKSTVDYWMKICQHVTCLTERGPLPISIYCENPYGSPYDSYSSYNLCPTDWDNYPQLRACFCWDLSRFDKWHPSQKCLYYQEGSREDLEKILFRCPFEKVIRIRRYPDHPGRCPSEPPVFISEGQIGETKLFFAKL